MASFTSSCSGCGKEDQGDTAEGATIASECYLRSSASQDLEITAAILNCGTFRVLSNRKQIVMQTPQPLLDNPFQGPALQDRLPRPLKALYLSNR